MGEGAWRIPGGEVRIDAPLARALLDQLPEAVDDAWAHKPEHCLEVQIPFLLYGGKEGRGELRIVPILMSDFSLECCRRLGAALAQALKDREETWTIVASSDMNHYESQAVTERKDRAAIEAILRLDAEGLIETVRREDVSMCGFGPMAATLVACRAFGAEGAELVRHETSGDVSGDYERVVGYAGIIIG
jgi:AmmeMemoRadiSam system protein B